MEVRHVEWRKLSLDPPVILRLMRAEMHIGGEAKIGIALSLVLGIGAGAVAMYPDQKWIGLTIIVFSVLGLIALTAHHWRERLPSIPIGHVSFHEAALRMYEHLEARGLRDLTFGDTSPLEQCKLALISMAQEGRIVLHGNRAPSRQSLPLSTEDLRNVLPVDENSLRSIYASARARRVDNIWLTRRDAKSAANARADLLDSIKDLVL